jgi:hypothetical protein
MYRFITFLFTLLVIANAQAQAGKTALIAGGAALVAGFAAYASVEQVHEGLEQQATEWFLANHAEERLFRLKIKSVSGTKLSDLSNVSCMLYTVHTYDPDSRKIKDKFILLGFHSHGWINENGVNFQKISYYLINKNQWEEFIKLWVETVSPVKIDWKKGIPDFAKCNERKFDSNDSIYIAISNNVDGVVSTNYFERTAYSNIPIFSLRFSGKSIEKDYDVGSEEYYDVLLIPINKVDGDTYIRSERKLSFIDSYLIGNEKTICLFRAEEQQLVQLNLDLINFVQSVFSKEIPN